MQFAKQNNLFIVGEAFALLLFSLGLYLVFFDTTKETKELVAKQSEQNVQIATALKAAEEEKKKDERFTAFLVGFSEDEKKLLAAIHEQDGILQSTLRYRTGLTKTDVSFCWGSVVFFTLVVAGSSLQRNYNTKIHI